LAKYGLGYILVFSQKQIVALILARPDNVFDEANSFDSRKFCRQLFALGKPDFSRQIHQLLRVHEDEKNVGVRAGLDELQQGPDPFLNLKKSTVLKVVFPRNVFFDFTKRWDEMVAK
jgi:hypothetical protein